MEVPEVFKIRYFLFNDRDHAPMEEMGDSKSFWARIGCTLVKWHFNLHRRLRPCCIIKIQPFKIEVLITTQTLVDKIPVRVSNILRSKVRRTDYIHKIIEATFGFLDGTIPKPLSEEERAFVGVRSIFRLVD
jgi:hypothetical protein